MEKQLRLYPFAIKKYMDGNFKGKKFRNKEIGNMYLLYGENLIKNDNTLKEFAQSLCNGVPTEGIDKNNFKENFMDLVERIIIEDISRTEINYEHLMYKYRLELGDLIYEMDNHGFDISFISFFGDRARESFNQIVYQYINIHFNELIYK